VRFAPGGIRKGAAGYDICFLHPKGNDDVPAGRRGRADRAGAGAARRSSLAGRPTRSTRPLDERERGVLQAELQRIQADAATQQWVAQAIERPTTAAEVAALAQGPEMAAEIYLASVLMVDESNPAERSYLDELAQQLRLAPSLKADLEAKALAA
jgi:hypothetical protein